MTTAIAVHDEIATLTLGQDENRFSPTWLDAANAGLDRAERDAKALITIGAGKFYSNGLDLEWLMSNGDQAEGYIARVQALLARIVTFPLPTVAAINGHAFGAGAMLAIAHDYRVMRDDRGYFCLPEVDLTIPFTPGMSALIQSKMSPQTALTAMTTGRRFGGPDALESGIADAIAAQSALADAAAGLVAPLVGKNPATLGAIKGTMFASVVAALN